MTEEQFWHSNIRKIQVYEKAFKEKVNLENRMNHILGAYVLNAVSVSLGNALDKKYKGEYLQEPIRIFPMTEQEKEELQKKELEKFIAWTGTVHAAKD